MDGLFGTHAPSLRPTDAGGPLPPLPRRVLRHMVTLHGLGIGSRLIIGGDESQAVASFFCRLGVEAITADEATADTRGCDAAIWFTLNPVPARERSLLGTITLERSAELLTGLRPGGTFLLVARLGEAGVGHQPGCLEAHLACFSNSARVAVFPERSFAGLLGGGVRSVHAVASCRVVTSVDDPLARHRLALVSGSADYRDACCRWSAQPARGAA